MPEAMDGLAVRGKLRSALVNLMAAATDVREAIYDSDDWVGVARRTLAAEEALQLAVNDLTEVMLLAKPLPSAPGDAQPARLSGSAT